MHLKDTHILTVVPLRKFYFHDNYFYQREDFVKYLKELSKHFDILEVIAPVIKGGEDFLEIYNSELKKENINFCCLPFEQKEFSKLRSLLLMYANYMYLIYNYLKGAKDVYIFMPSNVGLIACLWSIFLRKRIFLYVAGDALQLARLNYVQNFSFLNICRVFVAYFNTIVTRLAAKRALFCLVAGEFLYEKYKRINRRTYQRIPIMKMSYENLYFREDTCKDKPVRCLFVGSLNPLKGVRYLLQAIKTLKREGIEVSLDIVGSGTSEGKLKNLSNILGIENIVYFRGYIANSGKLFETYRQSDIFVLPTLTEGFPRVVYEAMGHSLPIIVTRVGGISTFMKHKENTLQVPARSDRAIAEAIKEIISNPLLRQRMIRNGQKLMKSICSQSSADQFISLYLETKISQE